MALYRIGQQSITPIKRTTFAAQGLRERQDLQALLRANIDVIAPETLVVAEEFGEWEDSRRRIDLLGIDKSANLVVIELKRTEDGGHMELQAIRYAAMVSTLTFDKLVGIYAKYLADNRIEQDATTSLLEFLDWSEPDEEQFGQEVKIVLASAEFSKELTTAVMWLNDFGLDIRCVRLQPYLSDEQLFLDVQTVIPIPEVADYQVRIRDKKQREREARQQSRDLTKYDVEIGDNTFPSQNKRRMMYQIIAGILHAGGTPEQVIEAIPWKGNTLFETFDGDLSGDDVRELLARDGTGKDVRRVKRFFCSDEELFRINGRTLVMSNQWGTRSVEAAESLARRFPALSIRTRPASEPDS